MELTLLRHAESEYNNLGLFQGRLNSGLSKHGIKETMERAKDFDSSLFDVCFSSPLMRTLQTTEILVPDLPYLCDERLIERNLGDWQNTPITREKLYFLNQLYQTPPNGESIDSIMNRVQNFMDFLDEHYSDKRILVITHSGIISAIQMILGLETKEVDNLETFKVNFSRKRLVRENK